MIVKPLCAPGGGEELNQRGHMGIVRWKVDVESEDAPEILCMGRPGHDCAAVAGAVAIIAHPYSGRHSGRRKHLPGLDVVSHDRFDATTSGSSRRR